MGVKLETNHLTTQMLHDIDFISLDKSAARRLSKKSLEVMFLKIKEILLSKSSLAEVYLVDILRAIGVEILLRVNSMEGVVPIN